MDYYGVTVEGVNLLRCTRSAASAKGQLLTSPDPGDWVLAGRGEKMWFAGVSGAALVKGRTVLYLTVEGLYVLSQNDWSEEPSIAILDMVSNAQLSTNFEFYGSIEMVVVVELFDRTPLIMHCEKTPSFLMSWWVRCIDPRSEPT